MTFEEWNKLLYGHFFRAEYIGTRVYLSATEDLIVSLGGSNSITSLVEAVRRGPDCHLKHSRGILSRARVLCFNWVKNGKPGKPPFLPYLAVFVLAANYESAEGHSGYHKRLRELIGESIVNQWIPGWGDMWELWQTLADWATQTKAGELGEFICSIEPGARTHVAIPISQTLLLPEERRRLGEIFSAAGLDPSTPVSDEELASKMVEFGKRLGLRPRTLKALTGENNEFRELLIESISEELREWHSDGNDETETGSANGTKGHRLLINLHIEHVSGEAQSWLRIKDDNAISESTIYLQDDSGGEYQTSMLAHGWSSRIQNVSPPETFPSINWTEGHRMRSADGRAFKLAPATFRIFENGAQHQLDNLIERQRLNPSAPFYLAVNEASSDLVTWGQTHCEGWKEICLDVGLENGWRLFSAQKPGGLSSIARKYPAFAPPIAARLRLFGGLKLGRQRSYLYPNPPKVEVETPGEEHIVTLNGNEILRVSGFQTISLPLELLKTDSPNKVSLFKGTSADGGRSHSFNLIRQDSVSLENLSFEEIAVHFSRLDAKVTGALATFPHGSTPYPTSVDLDSQRQILIGQTVGQIANATEWESLEWRPVWLLAKGRTNLRLQFCGNSVETDLPLEPIGDRRKAARAWEKTLYARRRDIRTPNNKKLSQLWSLYLQAAKK